MTQDKAPTFIWAASIALLLLFVVIALVSPKPDAGFRDAAAVLAIITGAAVGIERLLEAGWTAIGLTRGAWWPLNLVGQQVDSFVDGINPKLGDYYQRVIAELEEAREAGWLTTEQLAAARTQIDALPDEIDARITDLKRLAPDSQRVALITSTASESVNSLAQQYASVAPRLTEAADLANKAVSAAAGFAATFKDNPGRRLMSLFVGSWLGLLVAGVLGLDLFLAAGVTNDAFPHWGVAITGLSRWPWLGFPLPA